MLALRRLCWHGYKRKSKTFINIMAMSSFSKLEFDNKVLDTLPLDEEKCNRSRTVPGACFSLVDPTPVENPELVVYSKTALELLGINEKDTENELFAQYFSGNKLFSGSRTAAHCYCGHQFGYFSGQLGDGAAMYLGEIVNKEGSRWELQLKGAGKTPYSRNSDGRKVLRSSIREFLCSEAMHHLGIPTTRAGSCVTSDSRVVRDIFYDGHPIMERCTIVSRIAPTFLRFGSFEIFKPEDAQTGRSGPSVGRKDILEKMLEYAVTTFFPQILAQHSKEEVYLEFYKEVVRRTAKLVALWQCVGFCHGVLNTDNMSIMGITIDYGPFGFMDYFDKDFICNASDNNGRYSYQKQPEICKWNLLKFAEALQYCVPLDEMKKSLNEIYDDEFAHHYYGTMRKKIGITQQDDVDDEELIQKLLWTMQQTACDFTNTFQVLTTMPDNDSIVVEKMLSHCQDFASFKKRLNRNVNPQLRMLLKLAETHPSLLNQFGMDIEQLKNMVEKEEREKELMRLTPEEKKSNDQKLWSDWISLYRERLKLEMQGIVDASEIERLKIERKKSMELTNPKIVLRNHLAQEAIQAAEEGDFTKVQDLLRHLENPYSNFSPEVACKQESSYPICSAPSWASDIRVT